LSGPESLPVPTEVSHRYLNVNGCRFHLAEAGQGPTVVLLHGWPQHWWMWRHLIGPLSQGRRVICPDLRGLGWSEAPRRGYGRGDLARDLLGLLDQMEIDRAHLVAHDWGLIPGYWLALFWPWRVRTLVALGGPHIWAISGTPPWAFLRLWYFAVLASPLGPLAVRRGMAAHALRAWRHRGSFKAAETGAYLERVTRPESAKATARRYRRLVGDFLWFAKNSRDIGVSVPALNLVGEHDHLTNASRPNRYFETNAANLRYETVPEAGHFLAEERPELVGGRIREFLAEHSVTDAS
jgi:pimeloyl-ACP methyl ester carboxylesterase